MADAQRVARTQAPRTAGAAGAAGAQGAAAPQATIWDTINRFGKMFLVYFMFQKVMTFFKNQYMPASVEDVGGPVSPTTGANAHVQQVASQIGRPLAPLWNAGTPVDLKAFLTEGEALGGPDTKLLWEENGLVFGDWEERRKEITIDVPESVQHNGTLYAHFLLTPRERASPRVHDLEEFEPLYHRKRKDYGKAQVLTRYAPKRKVKKTKKLVAKGSAPVEPEEEEELDVGADTPIVSYWWPNVTITIVNGEAVIPANAPAAMTRDLRLSRDGRHYYPKWFVNDFWMLQDQLEPINATVKQLNMTLAYNPIAAWKSQMFATMDENLRTQNTMLGVASSETDDMKRMFLDTNPILLGVTMVVSLFHSLFDFLAFKNDIQFWQKKKDMEGLSFRAIVANVGFQGIIFLYLCDNDTSWMILISSGIGLLIEVWKIQKTVIIKQKSQFPFVEFIDRVKPSKLATKTKKYDEMAFRYVSYIMYPCLAGYAIYSLVYEEHKSWYSYIIGTLVGFVYAFGFITMTPQLFINYKMKSVAHMPWKTFMYKALNTFVDDLFAFVIKMPWLHRIACLRDDVVFLVYLYQRWIYPEDKRRRNEFGQVGEEGGSDDDSDEEEDAQKAISPDAAGGQPQVEIVPSVSAGAGPSPAVGEATKRNKGGRNMTPGAVKTFAVEAAAAGGSPSVVAANQRKKEI
ncbi:hypothetical protein HKX48_006006 [Thoreauomyces humboldtii]|nr:hypothetical protein HKX48_006006 [Thoreauomyces humboldtii]